MVRNFFDRETAEKALNDHDRFALGMAFEYAGADSKIFGPVAFHDANWTQEVDDRLRDIILIADNETATEARDES